MAVERLDPSQIGVVDGPDAEARVRAFIERDYRIRQGLCPNGCGLMGPFPDPENKGWKGQECGKCGFSTNQVPEQGTAQ